MRAVAALTLLAIFLPIPSFGQTAKKTTTFTSSDGTFRFLYPSDFQVCTRGKVETCTRSYIPVCDQDALVCVVYPATQFKDTNFGGASFQVNEILTEQEMMTANVCVTPFPPKEGNSVSSWPGFLISAEHPVEMIGGVQFLHGVSAEAALSHSINSDLYRAFHKQRCFGLSISQTWTNPDVSDPPIKTLTPAQQQRLNQVMSQILHSFRFSD
ncbi:MAG TPA: hypothetical protein VFL34_17535 [Candidatus Sulfotelmatobacter sp.]|nr:hypothetical protein [Candidatus Sulfotelmatobacter sp.]